jgi:hypothetical protein
LIGAAIEEELGITAAATDETETERLREMAERDLVVCSLYTLLNVYYYHW